MTAAPLITIGVTCYNAVDTIERAVRSALDQDWPNSEIIVVDDGSTDGSRGILLRLADDSRVIYVPHEQNKGYPGALNTIVQAARGEFVAFFDDDDESAPDRLSQQFARITDHEGRNSGDPVLCYTNRAVVPVGATAPSRTTLAIGRQSPEPQGAAVADFLLCLTRPAPFVWGEFGSCTLMARTETLRRIGLFDESFRRCAEWDLAIRLGLEGGHFIAVDAPLVRQYLTEGQDKAGKTPLRYALALRHKHKAYLKDQGVYWAAVAQAYARFHYAKGARWKSRFYGICACLAAPTTIVPHMLAQRAARAQA
ncbi:MAG: glycosyltransferase family 2 protein [Alphaproteobacteria bacterium]